jgi:hypothetical protein
MRLGQLIDSQGVELHLADDDLVAAVVVIAKVIDADGGVRLGIACSEGLDWLTRRGMAEAFRDGEYVEKQEWEDS